MSVNKGTNVTFLLFKPHLITISSLNKYFLLHTIYRQVSYNGKFNVAITIVLMATMSAQPCIVNDRVVSSIIVFTVFIIVGPFV